MELDFLSLGFSTHQIRFLFNYPSSHKYLFGFFVLESRIPPSVQMNNLFMMAPLTMMSLNPNLWVGLHKRVP